MPTNTLNFSLPYPSGSDGPCDFDEQWCDFTAAIDAVFDTFQAALDRSMPVIPAAKLRLSSAADFVDSEPVIFDTVVYDTAGFTDLDADPFHIFIDRAGRYTITCMAVVITQATVPPGFLSCWVLVEDSQGSGDTTAMMQGTDVGGGLGYFLAGYEAVLTVAAGSKLSLHFTAGSLLVRNMLEAYMSAHWHSDTERPS